MALKRKQNENENEIETKEQANNEKKRIVF